MRSTEIDENDLMSVRVKFSRVSGTLPKSLTHKLYVCLLISLG